MARLILLLSTAICLLASTSKYGEAHGDHHLGAAEVIADDFTSEAMPEEGGGAEGEGEGEGGGYEGHEPDPIFIKALECFNDKYIYSSCDEEYRLTKNGELNVPHDHADEYCDGPCLKETHLVLECIEEILKHFRFYNKATVEDVRETIRTGCSYGPKRGDFNVAKHVRVDEDIATKLKLCTTTTVVYATMLIIMGWHLFF